ncbi:short-chain dehydrogenase [Mycobacteroides chelonae]|uniref:Short-chain dehydrogenase n=1 Tax=Mycobacteroides chelonae TaxID=1774 RepID=A0AB73LMU3_MYCCH|nr:SDR family NAD(P)-dependent oxidoreductase [Mycobacteroides chelonae]KRQ28002.1 short-chain dehydrogenase [Mycobacteroides sp. H072]KRQ41576.1 short-chain dehydrogenase [Mycobacteroides sp. H002]KRQ49891.1 short-chain dehydrogenase [Mycobacteroides sp. H054]KRQ67460.1 short-chain dehydrogenase [Mycobacteroides sp. H001]OHT47577.1 short-chain dehydrogenase [Mycobacteroides chelonae]
MDLGQDACVTAHWSTADIPDQTGRVAIITGANTGLGLETARALAAAGAQVVLAVRDLDKGAAAVEEIGKTTPAGNLALQRLDLSSLSDIRSAAEQLGDQYPQIDLLINNAGVMYPPKGNTADGFELQFGTNHLGHFALTALLLENLTTVRGSRVVTVSSNGHKFRAAIHFDDLQWERDYSRVGAYAQSKLANLLFTYELQRRLQAAGAETVALAAHPGASGTELMRHITFGPEALSAAALKLAQSPAMGALPSLRAATDPTAVGGQYYGPSGFGEFRGYPKVVKSTRQSHDQALQQRLWSVSEELTGVNFPV